MEKKIHWRKTFKLKRMFIAWFPAGWNAKTVRSDVANYHLFTPIKVVISRISKKIILLLLSFVSISRWKTVWASSITWPTSWRPNVPSVSRSTNQRLILNWTGRKAPLVASARKAARLRKRYHLCSKLCWSWNNSHGSSSDLIFLIFPSFPLTWPRCPKKARHLVWTGCATQQRCIPTWVSLARPRKTPPWKLPAVPCRTSLPARIRWAGMKTRR